MRNHILTLATGVLVAFSGSASGGDDGDGRGDRRRGGPPPWAGRGGYGDDRREDFRRYDGWQQGGGRRDEVRFRDDRWDGGPRRSYDRGYRGVFGPGRDVSGYQDRPSPGGYAGPRMSPYLMAPPTYASPRTLYDLPGVVPGVALPGLAGDAYVFNPAYGLQPYPSTTIHEVRRPAFTSDRRQVFELTDTLVGQVGSFVEDFATWGRAVPEAQLFLAEAQTLNATAVRFREVLQGGADPGRMSAELRGVEDAYGRLATRTDRVAKGRTGPNIERTYAMGDTIQKIRQLLP